MAKSAILNAIFFFKFCETFDRKSFLELNYCNDRVISVAWDVLRAGIDKIQ